MSSRNGLKPSAFYSGKTSLHLKHKKSSSKNWVRAPQVGFVSKKEARDVNSLVKSTTFWYRSITYNMSNSSCVILLTWLSLICLQKNSCSVIFCFLKLISIAGGSLKKLMSFAVVPVIFLFWKCHYIAGLCLPNAWVQDPWKCYQLIK